MPDQVRINGSMLSWGSIKVKFDGDTFTGFTSISYGDSRERVKAYGMGRSHAPRGRSKGKYATDPVSLKGPKGSIQALLQKLADAGDGVSYGETEFQIVVQYIEPTEDPITVELEDCVITKGASSDEEGPDPLEEEVEIDCMRIKRNGLTLYDASEEN